ncbi:MAG TPA: CHAT domain-containing protein [Thermoanaerobaculia bacterium]|nr:CHAT domain-containing protein [Thermoanaerobaculia bacterium]
MASHDTSPLLTLLRTELLSLTADTLLLAERCALARGRDATGTATTHLAPTPEETAAAQTNDKRLQRWSAIVSSVLRRRGAAAPNLHAIVAELSNCVRLQRRDRMTIRKPQWRDAFAREVVTLRLTLEHLLINSAHAFVPLQNEHTVTGTVLNLHVRQEGVDEWRVRADTGGVRATEIVRALPLSQIQEFLSKYAGPRVQDEDVPRVLELSTQFGRQLFATLFQRSVGALYELHRSGRLRIQFAADSLIEIPWELLHDGTRFLALTTDVSIARGLAGPVLQSQPPSTSPFRVLLTISSPMGLLAIDPESERQTVEDAVASRRALGLLQLDVAPDGTMATLRRMIRNADLEGRPYDAWHFAGHGRYDADAQRSVIALTRENGDVHWIGGPELATIFAAPPPLRTAILKACEGARGDVATQWCDLVPVFLASGAESVLAMRFELSYDASAAFDREFYGALADGAPLDDAVAAARSSILDQSNCTEWITPVVFRRRGKVAWLDSAEP